MTGLIVAVIVVAAAFALWGVVEWDSRHDPRHDTETFPPIAVPGRDTPAAAHAHAPPWAAAAAVTQAPAGGSTVPAAGMVARETLAQPFRSPAAHETPAAGTPGPPAGDTLAPGSEPSGATGREPEPPDPVTAAFDQLRATIAELSRPTDEEQFPALMPAWEDDTGSFQAFIEDGA